MKNIGVLLFLSYISIFIEYFLANKRIIKRGNKPKKTNPTRILLHNSIFPRPIGEKTEKNIDEYTPTAGAEKIAEFNS